MYPRWVHLSRLKHFSPGHLQAKNHLTLASPWKTSDTCLRSDPWSQISHYALVDWFAEFSFCCPCFTFPSLPIPFRVTSTPWERSVLSLLGLRHRSQWWDEWGRPVSWPFSWEWVGKEITKGGKPGEKIQLSTFLASLSQEIIFLMIGSIITTHKKGFLSSSLYL